MNYQTSNVIVYLLNFPSGKKYVGVTHDLKQRLYDHELYAKNGHNFKISRAIRKYGIKSVKCEILKSDLNREVALKYEKYFIKSLNTYKYGYNSTLGGDGVNGHVYTEAQLNTKRNNTLKRYAKPGEREKTGKITKECWTRKEYREKTIKSMKVSALNRIDEMRTVAKKLWTTKKYRNKLTAQRNNVEYQNQLAISRGSKPFEVINRTTNQIIWSGVNKNRCREFLGTTTPPSRYLSGKQIHKFLIFRYIA